MPLAPAAVWCSCLMAALTSSTVGVEASAAAVAAGCGWLLLAVAAAATSAASSGETIDTMFENLPTVPPVARDGRVRPLAVTATARVPQLPEVPTTAEAGTPDFMASAFFTLAAPASTPPTLQQALNVDMRAALAQPATHQRLVDLGTTPRGLTLPEIRAYFAVESERWTRVIQAADLRAD